MTSRIDKKSPNQNKNNRQRQHADKEIYYKIVIVTEDSVNAVAYFKALLLDLHLWKVNAVTVDGRSDSTPEKVYDYAKNTYKHIYSKANHSVYCLIDRDDHLYFDETVAKDNEIPNLRVLESVPCFELWILLHFQSDWANNDRFELYKVLKDKWGIDKDTDDYAKVYQEKLKDKTKIAVTNSKNLYQQNRDSNPAYTKIHELMDTLNNQQ